MIIHRAQSHFVRRLAIAANMVALFAIFVPTIALSRTSGCGAEVLKPGAYTLRHGNTTRIYELRLPAGYDGRHPAPLVIAFHSWGGDEREFVGEPSVVAESSRRGYILVVPRGLGSGAPDHRRNSWTFRGSATGVVGEGNDRSPICDVSITPDERYLSCRRGIALNVCSWTQCQDDDDAFVAALVAHLESTLCVDPHRVYAAGGFNGGMFTWEIGQNERTAPLFRAIASIIGLPHRGDLRPPGRSERLPALLITGLADTEVPPGMWDDPHFTTSSNAPQERVYYTGATAITRRWAEAAGCPVAGKEAPFDAGHEEADCRSYCAANPPTWPVVLDCRSPMGHEYGFDWSWKLVLDFFDRS
jgi:polyhydroxybutyrate depolymerase